MPPAAAPSRHPIVRLIPRRIRYPIASAVRARRYGRASRSNVDIVDARRPRRWRRSPDTVRVLGLQSGEPIGGAVRIGDPAAADLAAHALGADGVAAAFAGPARPARWWERSVDPVLEPHGAALPPGTEPFPSPLAALEHALATGHRVAFVPTSGRPRRPRRDDPIDAPAVVVLSLVPMHDVGGGGRPAQLALALLERGFHVTMVHAHGAVGHDPGIRFAHRSLEQRWIWDFDAATIGRRARRPAFALVEAPAPELTSAAAALRAEGFGLVFDLIDDWGGAGLGWDWYDRASEDALIADADTVIASSQDLAGRVAAAGRTAAIVPNAVNEAVFGAPIGDRPPGLPEGTIIGYHGTLDGAWIDWAAIGAVAEAFPDAAVVLVGNPPSVAPALPPNVHLLGPRPQIDLPAIVGAFDAGIVPFAVTDTTHAVSPLKVYEYLACGVPVAAPPLRSLAGMSDVHTDADLVSAVRTALAAPRPDRAQALSQHGWSPRVDALLDAVGQPSPGGGSPARIEIRPSLRRPR